ATPVQCNAAPAPKAPVFPALCANHHPRCCRLPRRSPNYGLLGLALPSIDGLIGRGCTPTTVIGTGSGASCTQQAVCCTDNSFVS
ncbi:hypothetical protein HD554DRAFT_2018170, partial [Boletus coccyginus]